MKLFKLIWGYIRYFDRWLDITNERDWEIVAVLRALNSTNEKALSNAKTVEDCQRVKERNREAEEKVEEIKIRFNQKLKKAKIELGISK